MQNIKNFSIFLGTFVLVCLLSAASGFASIDIDLDRYQLTGPVNVDDHFDDNYLDPTLWDIDDPTATESGTMVTFSNTGTLDPMSLGALDLLNTMTYISTAFHSANGDGDLQATTTWNGRLPDFNQIYLMNLSTGSSDEDIIIGVGNWGIELATFFGAPTGPGVFFGRVNDVTNGDFDLQGIPIDPDDIIGSILLSIAFEDSTDLFTGYYSLNSGTTTTYFADTVASESGGFISGDWSIGTESFVVVPVPSSLILLLLGGLSLTLLYKKD